MENTEKKVGMLQPLITYGLILSLGLIIHSIVNYVLDIYDPGMLNKLLSWVIVGGLIFFGQYKYRNDYKGGYITYGQSLGFGVLMGVVAAVVSTLFFIVLIKVIDTGYMDRIMQVAEEQMYEKGMPEEQIAMGIGIAKKMMLIILPIGTVFISLIVSLITSIFVKKTESPFGKDEFNG